MTATPTEPGSAGIAPPTRSSCVAIWNPVSGGAPEEAELRSALGDDIELVSTTENDPGTGKASDAVATGARTVVACGGDGTVRAVIEALIGTEAALDLVPLGTGNLLAANLGVPAGLEAAGDSGRHPTRAIDVGSVNGEAFSVMAGSGFDALMIADASSEAKARFGTLAYALSGLRNLRRPLEQTTVTVDDVTWFSGRTSMVLVGNHGSMVGGLDLFPDAAADDGLLDVAVLAARTLGDWLGVFARLLLGRPWRSDLVEVTQGRRIEVVTKNPRAYELDGEARPPTRSLRYGIEPRALLVHDRTQDPEREQRP